MIGNVAAQTTTTCNGVGNTLYCNTSAPSSFSASDYKAIMDRHHQSESDHLHRIVGQMVMEGQCSVAKATALNAGDFDLAQQVDSTCRPPR